MLSKKGVGTRTFLAVQRCAVPRSGHLSDQQILESLHLVERVFREKSVTVRIKFFIFLFFLNVLSFFSAGKPFYKLNAESQHQVLMHLFDSRISAIRKGFWGINTLAKLSVYGQPTVYEAIGYRMKPVPHE